MTHQFVIPDEIKTQILDVLREIEERTLQGQVGRLVILTIGPSDNLVRHNAASPQEAIGMMELGKDMIKATAFTSARPSEPPA